MKRTLFGCFLALLVIVSLSGCSGSDSPLTPNPNAGPTASEVFAQYPDSVWTQIAGLDPDPVNDRSPGYLGMLNASLLLARSSAHTIEAYSGLDTVLYVYSSGWYARTTDTLYGGSLGIRWKLTPDPWRTSSTPTRYDREITLAYTDSLHITSTRVITLVRNEQSGTLFQGAADQQFQIEITLVGLPLSTITYGAPLEWSNLDCRKNTSERYLSPRGEFHAVGSGELARNTSTGSSKKYYYEGSWTIPASVAANDSIGTLRVGGELFATYYFVSFDDVAGVYRGEYQLANGGTRVMFTMYSL